MQRIRLYSSLSAVRQNVANESSVLGRTASAQHLYSQPTKTKQMVSKVTSGESD
jgi:hypothetical protein